MKHLTFYKITGSGNDFVIIDNRSKTVDEENIHQFVENICRRKISVGADGLILVESSDIVDFKWRFFNSDGSVAEMCGNGARCAARFAYLNNIAGPKMSFETISGIVSATVTDKTVKINIPDPSDFKVDYALELKKGLLSVSSINTGVPHVVIFAESIDDIEVVEQGREIRYHNHFAPSGTNVNFISPQKDGIIAIRTYERGVEDETLACGTGSVAGAIVANHCYGIESPVTIKVKSGGYLTVHFKKKDGIYSDICLEGDARVIYKGELLEDAWKQ